LLSHHNSTLFPYTTLFRSHTSILLAVADLLNKRREELTGNVKFVFQPAEERIGGAEPMIKEGAMQDVDGIIGLHLISDYPLGRRSEEHTSELQSLAYLVCR